MYCLSNQLLWDPIPQTKLLTGTSLVQSSWQAQQALQLMPWTWMQRSNLTSRVSRCHFDAWKRPGILRLKCSQSPLKASSYLYCDTWAALAHPFTSFCRQANNKSRTLFGVTWILRAAHTSLHCLAIYRNQRQTCYAGITEGQQKKRIQSYKTSGQPSNLNVGVQCYLQVGNLIGGGSSRKV